MAQPAFVLESSAFAEGETIPAVHTLEGLNLSPPLRWSGEPAATQSLALVVDDPDAPMGLWQHWLLFNIPAELHALPAGLERSAELANGCRQGLCWGVETFDRLGYQGPQPPPGRLHRYRFSLYALDQQLPLPGGCQVFDLQSAMAGHVLAQTTLTGLYGEASKPLQSSGEPCQVLS